MDFDTIKSERRYNKYFNIFLKNFNIFLILIYFSICCAIAYLLNICCELIYINICYVD